MRLARKFISLGTLCFRFRGSNFLSAEFHCLFLPYRCFIDLICLAPGRKVLHIRTAVWKRQLKSFLVYSNRHLVCIFEHGN